MACLDRSQGSIGVAVTCLTTQRVIYLKIKVKGFTVVTVFANHVIFTPAVGLRKAKQTVKKTLKSTFHIVIPRVLVSRKFKAPYSKMLIITCTVFLSSYRNTSGSLEEREMQWEHEPIEL